ncbi:MAG TPA: hypothetical protein VG127_09955 [Rubrobacteraceae bacterium]|jgi:hypothetical protein|nr:hypothetical protein [Rubrobacteraceae bacterium]
MARDSNNRLGPAEVEMILRRAAELNVRRRSRDPDEAPSISPEILVQVAAAAGIPEQEVRRAMWDLASEKTAEPHTFAWKVYGPARLRAVREMERPLERTREYLESLLRLEQGLKLRRKTEASSLWDSGDLLGVVRRTLDFSGHRALLKTQSVELRVEEIDEERCDANLTADLSNQRGEYLSLGGILGATLGVLFVLAGFQNPVFLLGVPPALAAPGFGFRFAYRRACLEIRRTLEDLLDAAEEGPPQGEDEPPERGDRPPGQIRGLKPIPRFAPQPKNE